MTNNNNEYKKSTNNTCNKLTFGWTLKNQCFSNAEKLYKLGLSQKEKITESAARGVL